MSLYHESRAEALVLVDVRVEVRVAHSQKTGHRAYDRGGPRAGQGRIHKALTLWMGPTGWARIWGRQTRTRLHLDVKGRFRV